jgi:hypothetical protein
MKLPRPWWAMAPDTGRCRYSMLLALPPAPLLAQDDDELQLEGDLELMFVKTKTRSHRY